MKSVTGCERLVLAGHGKRDRGRTGKKKKNLTIRTIVDTRLG